MGSVQWSNLRSLMPLGDAQIETIHTEGSTRVAGAIQADPAKFFGTKPIHYMAREINELMRRKW